MKQTYKCPHCGMPVEFGGRFCINCGTRLKKKAKTISKGKIVLISIASFIAVVLIVVLLGNLIRINQEAEYQRSDTPSISQNEACAMVYNYLQSKINSMRSSEIFQPILIKAVPYFSAYYMGKGQWSVKALGYYYNNQEQKWFYDYRGGLWDVYESSKIVQPSNPQANNLIQYWQILK